MGGKGKKEFEKRRKGHERYKKACHFQFTYRVKLFDGGSVDQSPLTLILDAVRRGREKTRAASATATTKQATTTASHNKHFKIKEEPTVPLWRLWGQRGL